MSRTSFNLCDRLDVPRIDDNHMKGAPMSTGIDNSDLVEGLFVRACFELILSDGLGILWTWLD